MRLPKQRKRAGAAAPGGEAPLGGAPPRPGGRLKNSSADAAPRRLRVSLRRAAYYWFFNVFRATAPIRKDILYFFYFLIKFWIFSNQKLVL